MKKILIVLLLILPTVSNAQYPPELLKQWADEQRASDDSQALAQHIYDSIMFDKEKRGELVGVTINRKRKSHADSLEFIDQYGSFEEFAFQEQQMSQCGHGYLVSFIGAKVAYISMLAEYMGQTGFGHTTELDAKDAPGGMAYAILTTKKGICIGCKVPPKIVIKALLNPTTERVKSVTITGDYEELTKLFIYYWPTAELRFDKLIKGKVIYQDHGSDRITFKWNGNVPFITITQNPNIGNLFAALNKKK